jgi:serine/threonine-protein kinase
MPIEAGTRIGPYEISGRLGAGGMGEVYRARDTRLDRQVAIKVLPDAVVDDEDRLTRFEREARVLATLNHPLIAQVYGFEQSAGISAIVMELVEGPTLEECITQRPLPVPAALRIARQIAEALEAAHELGIVHRDLKPANIKLLPGGVRPTRQGHDGVERRLSSADVEDGTVKVLDFGLAKSLDSIAVTDGSSSPTVTARATELGVILGTAAYMAPEQARGRFVDKRVDVWAFGVVLYEILTGTRLFKGADASDTLAAVLRQPIDFTSLPHGVPAAVLALLERCLERDPRQRLRDIGEARISLEQVLSGRSLQVAAPDTSQPSSWRAASLLPWLLFAGTAAALTAALTLQPAAPPRAPAGVTRLTAAIGVPGSLAVDTGPAAVLSPDGRTIVLCVRRDGTTRLYTRSLDQLEPVELAGTEHATHPFFSPDGRQVGFFASGGLKTMPIAGGATTTVTDAATGRGAAWDPNGEILFQPSLLPESPLLRVRATGGRTDRATTLAPNEGTHRWPQVLTGGGVLYSGHADVSNWDRATLRIQTTPGTPGKIVLRGGYHGRYVPTGHLLYVHAGTLYGARFDMQRLEVTSSPAPIIGRIASTHISGSAQFSLATDGTLAYIPGDAPSADSRIHWVTPRGETSMLATMPGAWGNPRFSPDGRYVALQVAYGSHDHIAVYDIEANRVTQLTTDAANHAYPIWMPNSRDLFYSSDGGADGTTALYLQRADGSGEPQRVIASRGRLVPGSVHPSGRFVVYSVTTADAHSTIHVVPIAETPGKGWTAGTPRALDGGSDFEGLSALSPDGRLVAYMQISPRDAGAFGVYVRPLEGEGGPWRVSIGTGAHPVWSKTSRELLFTTEDQIMTVPYAYDGREFTYGTPRPWTSIRYVTAGPTRMYDLHPDGTRILAAGPHAGRPIVHDKVVFVLNFFDELAALLPPGR